MSWPCAAGDGEESAFIVGNAQTGEQTGFCAAHMGDFGLEMALALFGNEEIVARMQAVAKQAAANAQEEKAVRRSRKRKPQPVAQPAQDGPEVPGVAETPPAADDR